MSQGCLHVATVVTQTLLLLIEFRSKGKVSYSSSSV